MSYAVQGCNDDSFDLRKAPGGLVIPESMRPELERLHAEATAGAADAMRAHQALLAAGADLDKICHGTKFSGRIRWASKVAGVPAIAPAQTSAPNRQIVAAFQGRHTTSTTVITRDGADWAVLQLHSREDCPQETVRQIADRAFAEWDKRPRYIGLEDPGLCGTIQIRLGILSEMTKTLRHLFVANDEVLATLPRMTREQFLEQFSADTPR